MECRHTGRNLIHLIPNIFGAKLNLKASAFQDVNWLAQISVIQDDSGVLEKVI